MGNLYSMSLLNKTSIPVFFKHPPLQFKLTNHRRKTSVEQGRTKLYESPYFTVYLKQPTNNGSKNFIK